MRWWWFWRENNRNKIPLIPTPHFHPQFSYPFTTTTIATFPWFPLFYHHDTHQCIFIVFSTTNTIFLFFCLHRHCHQNNHNSLLFPPPTPHCYCFPITITFLLFSPHRHCHHHISIVSRATLWRHTYKFSRCWYNHAWTCLYVVLILSIKNNGNTMLVLVAAWKQWKCDVGGGGGVKTMEMRWWCWWWRKQLQCDVCGGGFDVKTIEMWCCCSKEHALCWTADLLNVCTGAYPCLSKLSVSLKLRGVCVWLGVMLLHRYRAINRYAFGVGRLNSRGVWLF